MPELDYVVLADYVRQDAGMTHIMGAGIDTFTVPENHLPAVVPVGVVARITFDRRDEIGAEHEVSLIFHGPEDAELLRITRHLPAPAPAPGVPEHWRTAVSLTSKLALLLPAYGDDYRLEVVIDDDPRLSRSVDVRVVPADAGRN